jgi:hypothetical protein
MVAGLKTPFSKNRPLLDSYRLAGAIRGCNIGHKDSLESPQTDVLYFLVNQVLYGKSL